MSHLQHPVCSRRSVALTACGWALLAIFVATSAWIGDPAAHVRLFECAYLLGMVGFALLVWVVHRNAHPRGRWMLWFAGCVALRVGLAAVTPSDDLYRYAWEGEVQLAGYNPFIHAPDDPLLAPLRDADWVHINHPAYKTIYSPVAQWVFVATASLSHSIYAIKAVLVAFDLVTIGLLAGWLKRKGRSPHIAFAYGLCPLVLTAFGIQGHLDSLMLAGLAGAGWALAAKRPYRAAVLIGLAIAVKPVALLAAGWLIVTRWRAGVVCLAVAAATYLPYLSAGLGLFESLGRFSTEQEFFGLWQTLASPRIGKRPAMVVGCTLLVIHLAWARRRKQQFDEYLGSAFGLLVLVMPVVHFWYVSWVWLLAALRPSIAWLTLTGTLVFCFEAERIRHLTGQWQMPEWVWYAVYLPFVVVALVDNARRAAENSSGDG